MSADHAAFLREWAADIRRNSGKSVDADRLDQIADILSAPDSGGQTPPPQPNVAGLEDAIRGEGYVAGIAMSVAFLIRDRDEPSTALEWWRASGLTLDQCERANVDEYDMAPIRAALATTEGSTE